MDLIAVYSTLIMLMTYKINKIFSNQQNIDG